MRFIHDSLPQRVRFASGEAREQLAQEIDELGASRAMVIAAPAERPLAERITAGLPIAVEHDDVAPHVPVEVAERARAVAASENVDVLVTVGGGSTTGLAKAVALTSGVPIVAVPTTYAGSEATNVWGLTEGSVKTTGVDPRVLPRAVVYDAELTLSLPIELTVASGLNALAHCIDSLWAPRADPINAAMASEGIQSLASGLPRLVNDPSDLDGRELVLHGAYVSAVAFASAGSGLHHKICHVLGGMFDLPHAQTHAVVLPHVLAFNGSFAPNAEARIAAAFGAPTANEGLRRLREALGSPRALKDYGLPEDGLAAAAAATVPLVPAGNPAPVTEDGLVELLHAAWAGEEPK
ncbi:maleylacetate reductase [Leucobacter sp. CSA1]|uniref:Maleylacetate reductase n=1 Tax=Leucobacter chromiisoli TaxID=2796471 RepID=A0A934UUZ3_9MICO|nr:maleylacetate reductase [Leucobacter chromiisoli]MBK0420034.1 maleylacetate reductase [Leucobacter chromiisoli]